MHHTAVSGILSSDIMRGTPSYFRRVHDVATHLLSELCVLKNYDATSVGVSQVLIHPKLELTLFFGRSTLSMLYNSLEKLGNTSLNYISQSVRNCLRNIAHYPRTMLHAITDPLDLLAVVGGQLSQLLHDVKW